MQAVTRTEHTVKVIHPEQNLPVGSSRQMKHMDRTWVSS